ncbi:hypothetical protein [Clostridium botulinum]|uniref:hypothetical protein n=1 Tax=Clostridium botulinum TaxID=1491 RepID=UPI00174CF7E6|nr:hypothetical protein [Clostridium botulinum]MBD5572415.1 hypothetical protein [Clostridium botulinum]
MTGKKEVLINFLERWGVLISVLLTLIVTLYFKFEINKLKHYEQLFSNTITFVSILIGVLMSLMGFLLGFSDEKVVIRIKENNGDKILIKYFIRPIIAGIIIVIMSLVLEMIYGQNISNISQRIYIFISVIWSVLCALFLSSTFRVSLLMYLILTKIFDEADNKGINTNEKGNVTFDNPEDIY